MRGDAKRCNLMKVQEDVVGKIVELDLVTWAATQNSPGGPIYQTIERDIPSIEPATDEHGNVTRAGAIAWYITYGVAFVAILCWLWM